MSTASFRLPATGWIFAAGCLLTAICIDLSRYHARLNGDSIIPVLLSLYRWELFYWGQDRLGMVIPALATPFTHPFTNLLVQNGISIFGGLGAIGVFAWYLLRGPAWLLTACGGVIVFLFAFPEGDQFHVLNGSQPYLVPFALALGGILLASAGGRHPIIGAVIGVILTGLAYWYNSGLAIIMGPLAVGRFVADRIDPTRTRVPGTSGLFRWLWADSGIRELLIALFLTVIGTLFGWMLMGMGEVSPTKLTFTPISDWAEGWERMATGILRRFPHYLSTLRWLGAVGCIWLLVPTTRAVAIRCWLAVAVAAVSLTSQILICGTLEWTQMNDYDGRYAFAGLVALAPAATAVVVGPLVAVCPIVTRWVGWVAVASLPLAAIAIYGVPSVSAARSAVDQAAGRWTDDILSSRCTHLVGDYWAVWPAMFHTNTTLADRGDPRIVWGVAFRAVPSRPRWSQIPPEATRLGWLKRPGETEPPKPPDRDWQWAYPSTAPVEYRATLVVFVPI